jgi:hypothetical protein
MMTTPVATSALERRIAEHRQEVTRLRERFGDPAESLSAFVREHIDRDALTAALDEQLKRPGVWLDDEQAGETEGQDHRP